MSGEQVAGKEEKISPTVFLTKTFVLVDDQATDGVISWNENGTSFVVWNPTELAMDLLPKFFKHNNFWSFVRQLDTYGFRKIGPHQWEFANQFFRRGQLSLLCDTTSTASSLPSVVNLVTPEVSPLNSIEGQINSPPPPWNEDSSPSILDLMEENDELKREYETLNRKFDNMNVLFIKMLNLMWNQTDYAQGIVKEKSTRPNLSSENQVGESSRTIPMEMHGEFSPKLFGVNIGAKRSRMDNREKEVQLQLGGAYYPSDV